MDRRIALLWSVNKGSLGVDTTISDYSIHSSVLPQNLRVYFQNKDSGMRPLSAEGLLILRAHSTSTCASKLHFFLRNTENTADFERQK